MILGLFPAFMSMVAVYFILKAIGLTEGSMLRISLILIYSAGAGTGFYIAKGFFDTVPKSLTEAAILDGCTQFQVFYKVILPLSKPIVVYTVLTAFLAPWLDFVFVKVIVGPNDKYWTVSLLLYNMLEKEFINGWFTRWAAAAFCFSVDKGSGNARSRQHRAGDRRNRRIDTRAGGGGSESCKLRNAHHRCSVGTRKLLRSGLFNTNRCIVFPHRVRNCGVARGAYRLGRHRTLPACAVGDGAGDDARAVRHTLCVHAARLRGARCAQQRGRRRGDAPLPWLCALFRSGGGADAVDAGGAVSQFLGQEVFRAGSLQFPPEGRGE